MQLCAFVAVSAVASGLNDASLALAYRRTTLLKLGAGETLWGIAASNQQEFARTFLVLQRFQGCNFVTIGVK